MLTEKTPSAALVEGVSNLSDIDRTCADEGNMNSIPYTLLLFEYKYRPSDSVLYYR